MKSWLSILAVVAGLALACPAQDGGGSTQSVGPAELNAAFGIDLWTDAPLWTQAAAEVAGRLRWPKESATSASSSFRSYPTPPDEILGASAYALSLHGSDGKVSAISMIFANKGDIERMLEIEEGARDHQVRRETRRVQRDYKRFIREDARKIEETLTALLGPPAMDRTGDTARTREIVKRWDWQGHLLLLAAPRDEYVALRIAPVENEASTGIERTTKMALLEQLQGRVVRRDNGDVLLGEMPMVDQGPKGYCVPATWERVLRYMGIPADMNVLAMAGGTGVGGGTTTRDIAAGVGDLVRRYGRRLVSERAQVNHRSVASHIDKGLPIMWTMTVLDDLNAEITMRSGERTKVSDWAEWKTRIDGPRREARRLRQNPVQAHVCMIIGYNRDTGEVAVSDSWGPAFAERWMTFEEAEAISLGEFTTIQP